MSTITNGRICIHGGKGEWRMMQLPFFLPFDPQCGIRMNTLQISTWWFGRGTAAPIVKVDNVNR